MIKGIQEIKRVLDKRVEDLTSDEADLLVRLSFRNVSRAFLTILPLVYAVLTEISFVISGVDAGVFIAISSGFFTLSGELSLGKRHSEYYSLNALGITKEDWKELKKAGLIKKAKQMSNEYYKATRTLTDKEAQMVVVEEPFPEFVVENDDITVKRVELRKVTEPQDTRLIGRMIKTQKEQEDDCLTEINHQDNKVENDDNVDGTGTTI